MNNNHTLSKSAQSVQSALNQKDIHTQVVELPSSTRTAQKDLKKIDQQRIGLSVFDNNQNAQKLYQSAGFQVIEEKRTPDNNVSYWKMYKTLSS